MTLVIPASSLCRLRLTIDGVVQGVGFRPFVYRLATELGLTGWVRNTPQGVCLEVEGSRPAVQEFRQRLVRQKPPRATIDTLAAVELALSGDTAFTIRSSAHDGTRTATILPDIATCADCRRDIFDPRNRRYRYPFTNCTNCGPRYSIIEALPYDRQHTTMRQFTLCAPCRAEYDDPANRRFHAQPNACPQCGPHLELWDGGGTRLASHQRALHQAAVAIRRGAIVAVKGLGGFQLMVDARNQDAVWRLRQRKQRHDKPFALMFASLSAVHRHCDVTPPEARLLRSPAAPIVLVRRRAAAAPGSDCLPHAIIAPDNPHFGVMLPYTPLHHLLLHELGFPVVASSGNRSDEPMCIDEHDALRRLGDIAEFFLVHDRPIARGVDDSVVQVVLGEAQMLRSARGYAPWQLRWSGGQPAAGSDEVTTAVLGVGGHVKNTIAVSRGATIVVSQHLGDLDTVEARAAFDQALEALPRLYDASPTAVACDLHPDYYSTRQAEASSVPLIRVQHHYAHVLAGMAEHGLQAPVLGVAWDGTGYGPDGTVWGGEFLHITDTAFRRVAGLRPFGLPGGVRAIREPWRTALGVLYEVCGDDLFARYDLAPLRAGSALERRLVHTMLRRQVQTPRTSSVGRLFDAIAALLGLRQRVTFEGQAAMDLEYAVHDRKTETVYPCGLDAAGDTLIVDWTSLVRGVLTDLERRVDVGHIAATFHHTLVEILVEIARRLGDERVVLSGGCFQNRYLTERAVTRLRAAGFRPYWHRRVPPNDGGVALGQVAAVLRSRRKPLLPDRGHTLFS